MRKEGMERKEEAIVDEGGGYGEQRGSSCG